MSRIVQDGKAGIDLTQVYNPVSTTPLDEDPYPGFALGTKCWADSGLYMLCVASGTVEIASVCEISSAYAADTVTTAESGSTPKTIGVAVSALTDGQYGWFWRGFGVENVSVATTISADTQLTTTSSAGVAGSGGDNIIGLVTIGETSGGAAVISCLATGPLSTNSAAA